MSANNNPALRYLNEFTKLKCAPDLLAWGLFPNAKEITESLGAYNAIRKHIRWDLGDPTNNCVVVGDGNTPRTAAVIACRSNWNVVSIDPRMKKKHWPIRKLTTVIGTIEEYYAKTDAATIIVAVHSHADLSHALANITSPKRAAIAIPCCKKQEVYVKSRWPDIGMGTEWRRPADMEYFDFGIASPQNKVKIWFNV